MSYHAHAARAPPQPVAVTADQPARWSSGDGRTVLGTLRLGHARATEDRASCSSTEPGPAEEKGGILRRQRGVVLHWHRTGRVVLVFALGLVSTACATARVGQFDAFARAGIQFTDAVTPVVDQAFETAVATDTLLLLRARKDLTSSEERLERLQSSDEVLSERLQILNDLKRHN